MASNPQLPAKNSKDRVTLSKSNSALLLSIKKRLAWNLCADLLNPPITAIGALKYDDDDSGENIFPSLVQL
jgi:hypothetical protein